LQITCPAFGVLGLMIGGGSLSGANSNSDFKAMIRNAKTWLRRNSDRSNTCSCSQKSSPHPTGEPCRTRDMQHVLQADGAARIQPTILRSLPKFVVRPSQEVMPIRAWAAYVA
jgi:hypothetical protein